MIFLSLFLSEDYILAHDCTLQETQKSKQQKKRTSLIGRLIGLSKFHAAQATTSSI